MGAVEEPKFLFKGHYMLYNIFKYNFIFYMYHFNICILYFIKIIEIKYVILVYSCLIIEKINIKEKKHS